jgi:hypothetical protein
MRGRGRGRGRDRVELKADLKEYLKKNRTWIERKDMKNSYFPI